MVYCAVSAMLVLLLAVAAGCCNFDYVPNHDIVVLKLAPDGALAWTRVVDHGFDDAPQDIVELPDGGFAVAGHSASARLGAPRPMLVRLSPEGAVVWERFATDGFDVARAVVSAGDGDTAVLTGNGTVARFDHDGSTTWTRVTGIPEASALVPTADGGYLAGGRVMYQVPVNNSTAGVIPPPIRTTAKGSGDGPVLAAAASRPTTPQLVQVPRRFDMVQKAMVVRLDPDGAIEWERQYDDGGLDWLQSLAEDPIGGGILVAGYDDIFNASADLAHPLLALRLLPDGTPAAGSQIDTGSVGDPIWLRSDAAGYRMLYQNATERPNAVGYYDMHIIDTVLDREGRVLEQQPIDASIAVTWTTDGGYFSVGIPPAGNRSWYDTVTYNPAGTTFHARRLDRVGGLVWDRVLPGAPLGRVVKVVPTADGGHAVLAEKQNR